MAFPSFDQIQRAAYDRWERRSYRHGHDRDDWLASEQDLLFAMNYEIVAHYQLADTAERHIGEARRPVCRFCERSTPATTFQDLTPAVPEFLGNASLFTFEECDECRAFFVEEIEEDLTEFLASSPSSRRTGGRPVSRANVSFAALKGLAKMAISIMPRRELASCEGTVEWVCNPDHDFDASLFGGSGGYVHHVSEPFPCPWVALARRTDDDAPMPYLLFFLGTSDVAIQVPVPLCVRDEDLEGMPVIIPQISSPSTIGCINGPTTCSSIPLATSHRRLAALAC